MLSIANSLKQNSAELNSLKLQVSKVDARVTNLEGAVRRNKAELSASQSISEKRVLELSSKLIAIEKATAKAAEKEEIKAKFAKKAAEEIAKLDA